MVLFDLRKQMSAHLLPYDRLDDAAPIPETGAVLIDLLRLQRDAGLLSARRQPVGLIVDGNERADNIVPYFASLSLIAIRFPKFSDGRGFSLAHRLRRNHDYRGEIRAMGEIIGDHADFLLRTGFTSVVLPDRDAAETFKKRLGLYSVRYQDAFDARPTVPELRHGQSRLRLVS